ncbi:Asp-tRNA(Asn)/Glu-tRNA(Gln) amidotransferase subunit GatA [Oscillospiraceae bacterium MB08-C2-2]|nr:Asp-tRNA(Asn)/Glu-tRNA(Gln) amidotransferase subunit GatA [Oscillospiraceae bacterium MB08-C2-2]
MKEILSMTALEMAQAIHAKELSSPEATQAVLDAIKAKDSSIGAYRAVMEEQAIQRARQVQEQIEKGESLSPLAGVPVAVKDNISTQGVATTCSSRMLENYKPIYNAGVVEKLEQAGAVIVGKLNMDEFAMGGSCETSFFGPTRNPWNTDCVPGGSSGGAAAAVAAREAVYTLGSDTGGSIRQPCSFCGTTGIKPTYGSVSRYGLIAYASSLDQIGPIGRDVKDCAAALSVISGHDKRDSTSIIQKPFDFSQACGSIKGMCIALPREYFADGVDPDVAKSVLDAAKTFERLGAVVEECSIRLSEYAVPAYYIIACAEASSNLSRYDGIKYGFRAEGELNLAELYTKSRTQGFGPEVRRRIMLGSFVLSSGYFDAYYKKALKVRGLIKQELDGLLEKYDMILAPVAPTTAYPIGQNIDDPLKMYMGDIFTVSVNLAGIPSVALPCGFDGAGMPVGMQLIGKAFSEPTLVKAGIAWQEATDFHTKAPERSDG